MRIVGSKVFPHFGLERPVESLNHTGLCFIMCGEKTNFFFSQ